MTYGPLRTATAIAEHRWLAGIRAAGWATFSILAFAGAGVAAYLTYLHWSEAKPAFCAVDSGCATVNRSAYSTLGPVPVALLGSLLYASLLVLGLGGLATRVRWAAPLAAGMVLFGLAFSSYLTYAEVAVLHAICVWCLASLAIITTLVALAGLQVWLHLTAPGTGFLAPGTERAAGQP